MNQHISRLDAADRNRRGSFRVNDRVALQVRVLSESEYRELRGRTRTDHGRRRQINSILAASESQRGALRNVRDTDPALAAYLHGLEERLEALVRMLGEGDGAAPPSATHDVNLSGNGILFPPASTGQGLSPGAGAAAVSIAHLPEPARHGGARDGTGARAGQRRALPARGGLREHSRRRPRTADPPRAQPAAGARTPWPAAPLSTVCHSASRARHARALAAPRRSG